MTTAWRCVTTAALALAIAACWQKEADSLRAESKRSEQRVATLEKKADDTEYVIQELDVTTGKATTAASYHGQRAQAECEEQRRGWESALNRPGSRMAGRFSYTCRQTR